MMRLLEAGGIPVVRDDPDLVDEANPHGYYEYKPINVPSKTANVAREILRAHRFAAVKLLAPRVNILPPGLGEYRFIWMRRNPHAIMLSKEKAVKLWAEKRYVETGVWDHMPVNRSYQELSELGYSSLAQVMDIHTRSRFSKIALVNYEDLVSTPHRVLADLTGTLSLNWTLDRINYLAKLVDPSLNRNG
jgi:hypothetical protein